MQRMKLFLIPIIMEAFISPVASQEPMQGKVTINDIVSDDHIEGNFAGIPTPQDYCIVVYVHTDIWYIHPYAGQGVGKSFATVDQNGNWRISTVKREFRADQIAAVARSNCANVPTRASAMPIKPNNGYIIMPLSGTKFDNLL